MDFEKLCISIAPNIYNFRKIYKRFYFLHLYAKQAAAKSVISFKSQIIMFNSICFI